METWKQTFDPTIEVSDDGQVRSTKRHKLRRLSINGNGYVIISMLNPATGRHRRHRLHRVIWETFRGSIPPGTTIDHFSRIKTDNSIDNLRVVPRVTNQRNKTKARGQRASVFIGVYRTANGRYRGRCKYQLADKMTRRCVSSVDAGAARDDVAVTLAGELGASLNFPRRYGLQTPPAHQPIELRRIRPHFALGLGYLWVSIERAAIDDFWIHVDMLVTVELDGQTMIRVTDAFEWHVANLSKFPEPFEAFRLLISYCNLRGAL